MSKYFEQFNFQVVMQVFFHDMLLRQRFFFFYQAVEFLAEWALTPSNMAFLRVNTGVCDPALIGDKSKWYAHTLEPMTFKVWQEGSSLGTTLRAGTQIENPPTGKMFSL